MSGNMQHTFVKESVEVQPQLIQFPQKHITRLTCQALQFFGNVPILAN